LFVVNKKYSSLVQGAFALFYVRIIVVFLHWIL